MAKDHFHDFGFDEDDPWCSRQARRRRRRALLLLGLAGSALATFFIVVGFLIPSNGPVRRPGDLPRPVPAPAPIRPEVLWLKGYQPDALPPKKGDEAPTSKTIPIGVDDIFPALPVTPSHYVLLQQPAFGQ